MSRTTKEIFEDAYDWAMFQRTRLIKELLDLAEEERTYKKHMKELRSEIQLLDEVLEQLDALKEKGGVEEA